MNIEKPKPAPKDTPEDTSWIDMVEGKTSEPVSVEAVESTKAGIDAPAQTEAQPATQEDDAASVRERLAQRAVQVAPIEIPRETKVEAPIQAESRISPYGKLIESLGLKKSKDGFYPGREKFLDRLSAGENPAYVLEDALKEEARQSNKRESKIPLATVMTGALGTAAGTAVGGIGAATGATAFGMTGAPLLFASFGWSLLGVGAPVLAAGGVGWAGYKIFNAIKKKRHAKEYKKQIGREPRMH